MTLQPIMMYQNTEFGSKMFGGLENIIWINIDILTLRCDLDLECNNPIFPQDALACDNLSSDYVWLPKNQQFRRYRSQSNILIIVSWYFEPSQPQRVTSWLKTMFNLTPIYSARKSTNHKLTINHKIRHDTNLHKTKHTQTSDTKFSKN